MICVALSAQAQFPFRADTVQFEKVDIPALENRHKQILMDDKGVLWLGEKGLFRFYGKNWDHYSQQKINSTSSVSNLCVGLSKLIDNQIGITFGGSGVLLIDVETGYNKFINPAEFTGDMFYNRIHHGSMPILNNDSLLIISNGFAYYDLTEEKLTPFMDFDKNIKLWEKPWTSFIPHPTRSDLVWIYRDKLYLVNSKTGDLEFTAKETIPIQPKKTSPFHDKLVVTGNNTGMMFYDMNADNWESFFYEENKSVLGENNSIYDHIYLGDSIFLFAGGRASGLFDYTTKSFSFFQFPVVVPEGHNVYFNSAVIDDQGIIWCSSWLGLFRSVHPVFKAKKSPELLITSIRYGNEKMEQIYPETNKKEHLLRQDDQLDIKFELANPAYPKKVQYAYRLEHYDKQWSPSSNTTTHASYTKLPPGNYRLHIKAIDHTGKEYLTSIDNIIVKGFFFQTWWFKFLVLSLVIGMLIWIYKIRTNKIRFEERLKVQYENKLIELKMMALRSQMNPHFIFNSMNSIKSYLINKGKDEAIDYLTKFSVLMRTILENSKKELLTLQQEINALKLYILMENKRLQSPFEFELDIDDELDLFEAKIPPMIIQPHVENAIWHGLMPKSKDRKLKLKILKTEQGFLCIVEDNGVGRNHVDNSKSNALRTKTSLGTSITKSRIDSFNKMNKSQINVEVEDLYDQMGNSIGTRVKIFVELIKGKAS